MATWFNRYADYILFLLVIFIKLWIFSVLTDTYFGPHLAAVTAGGLFLLSGWTLLIAPGKRRWLLFALSIALTILIASNLWYYRYFTDLLSVALMIQIPQMGDVGSGLQDLMYWYDFLLFADAFLFGALLLFDRKRILPDYNGRRLKSAGVAIAAGLTLFFAPVLLVSADREQWLAKDSLSNVRNYYELGMIGHHAVDLGREANDQLFTGEELSADEFDRMQEFFKETTATAGSQPDREKPNVVVLQLESFQASVIGQEIDGQVLTPNLNAFMKESLYFSSVFHQTHQGRTSDAEFIINTSLYPLKAGSVYTRYPTHSYDSLPGKMEDNGYDTAAFHAFRPDFWNRDQVYEQFGFNHFYSIDDFPDGETIGLTLNDEDFFLSSVDRMMELEEPFYSFMVALTSHTPYGFPDDRKTLDMTSVEEEIIQNYYHTVHYVDSAFGSFREKLEEEGIWDDALIVVYGDHDSGLQEPERQMAELAGVDSEVDQLILDRTVPLFIKLPDMEKGETVDKRGGQVDIAPTILSLTGLDKGYMMGHSLLDEEDHPVLFRDGSFVYQDVYYKADLTKKSGNGQCYNLETEEQVSREQCEEQIGAVAEQLRLSDDVIKKNGIKQLQQE